MSDLIQRAKAGVVVDTREIRDDLSDVDIPATNALLAEAAAEIERLQRFKDWVHAYLDGRGIPADPGGPHSKEGCRIGDRMDRVFSEIDRLKIRLLSAAGDDLCRLSQEEIKAYTSGKVQIPPEEEFIPSCRRFHAQIASEAGVMKDCLTLAQLVAENERLRSLLERVPHDRILGAVEFCYPDCLRCEIDRTLERGRLMTRDPRIDPQSGDKVVSENGKFTRTVQKRFGFDVLYQTQLGRMKTCWITTWQDWCRKNVPDSGESK